jgi:hypothetical protein
VPAGTVPSLHVGLGSCSTLDLVVQTLGAAVAGGLLAGGGGMKQAVALCRVEVVGTAAGSARSSGQAKLVQSSRVSSTTT